MFKTALSLVLMAFLSLSCAGKPYDYLHGKPKLNMAGNSRMAMVRRPYLFSAKLTGQMPAVDQYVTVIVKVDGEERMRSTGTMAGSRTLPSPTRKFVIVFTESDYYQALDRLRGDSFGRTYVAPDRGWDEMQLEDTNTGWLTINVEVWLSDPHPYKSDEWVPRKRYAVGQYKIKISCPHCTY